MIITSPTVEALLALRAIEPCADDCKAGTHHFDVFIGEKIVEHVRQLREQWHSVDVKATNEQG